MLRGWEKSQQSFFKSFFKAPFAPGQREGQERTTNHKNCMTFIKFFLKRNCPYMKNLYKVFLINCLSLNLMIIKPIECEGVINEHELLKSLPSIDNE